ncbi:hypothetical protein DW922_04720 [Clostridium sp. AM42-4]|nr:hypothetical protein DW922_04720 [Clostridium sp. AM42-4]
MPEKQALCYTENKVAVQLARRMYWAGSQKSKERGKKAWKAKSQKGRMPKAKRRESKSHEIWRG